MCEEEADKTDGIVWRTSKPKLISRNYSTGNLQSLEKQPAVLESTSNGLSKFAEVPKRRERKRSLASLLSVPSIQTQLEGRSTSESFFKEFAEKFDAKLAEGSQGKNKI